MAASPRYRRVWRGRPLSQLRAVERHSFRILQDYANRVVKMSSPNFQDATVAALNSVVAAIATEVARRQAVLP